MFERQFLTLVGVSVAAAVAFTWGSAGYRQRDALQHWADARCAAAGATYAPPAKSKTKPGKVCADEIARLAAFERDTNRVTAGVLVTAMEDRARKSNNDAAKARTAAEAAAAATTRMEKANAEVEDDRVGGAWFGALNQSAGLRSPRR